MVRAWPRRRTTGCPGVRLVVSLYREFEQVARRGDLSMAQYRTLLYLLGGSRRAGELAAANAVTKPTVSTMINGLRQQGWVADAVDETGDGRVTRIELTRGRAVQAGPLRGGARRPHGAAGARRRPRRHAGASWASSTPPTPRPGRSASATCSGRARDGRREQPARRPLPRAARIGISLDQSNYLRGPGREVWGQARHGTRRHTIWSSGAARWPTAWAGSRSRRTSPSTARHHRRRRGARARERGARRRPACWSRPGSSTSTPTTTARRPGTPA